LIETASVLGSEEVTNGDFATDSDWNLRSVWVISNGICSLNAPNSDYLSQSNVLTANKSYKLTFDIVVNSGNLQPQFFDGGFQTIGTYNTTQSVEVYFLSSSSGTLYFKPNSFDGSIDNVSVKEQITSNIPRVDYLNNANGSLLLEPQRTNLNTYSEDIPQNYVTTEISDTFEYSTSPNGLQTSTRLQLSNLGSSRYVHTLTGIVSSGTAYAFSCYYKGTLGETAYMYALPVGGTAITKAITFTGEWQRENLTFTAGASSNYVYIVDSRQGGDASDFEVWGAQSEEGSYPTSYIPTSGTTVTRLQDTSLTSGLSSVINSVEGVIFLEMAALANDSTNRYISINDGTSSKRIIFKFGTSSNNIAALGLGTASSFSMSYSGATITNMNKIALKYKANDCALWVNGVEVATDTTFTAYAASTLSHIAFSNSSGGGQWLEANVQNLMVFPSALTDTELATLTTI
jgi:hypothetical protein